ncbi:hypothetical protein ANO14919_122970 [Xylariales sp. No.14919]|nr:hypothetical protein ANO14919_122970 [Xylariales sp. No.14919]
MYRVGFKVPTPMMKHKTIEEIYPQLKIKLAFPHNTTKGQLESPVYQVEPFTFSIKTTKITLWSTQPGTSLGFNS